jgi:hypothetical protein
MADADAPLPRPAWFARIAHLRMLIGDPPASEIVYAEALPADGYETDDAWTTADGAYWKWTDGKWQKQKIILADSYIRAAGGDGSVYRAGGVLLDTLLARINPLDYLTGGTAGGQSLSFSSLAEVTAFFTARKAALQELAEQEGTVRFCVQPVPVGDVYE